MSKPLKEAIEDVKTWRPEDRPVQFTVKHNPYNYGGEVRISQATLDADSKAPFFTEAYLYNLLGKEDARSLLGRIRRLIEAAEAHHG